MRELNQEKERILEGLLDIQSRSMRDNLFFFNFDEGSTFEEHKSEDCCEKVLSFCADKLCIDDACDRIKIDLAHRIGRYATGKKRPIVAKFNYYRDKIEIKQKARDKLNGSEYRIGEQFPCAIQERRKKLMPMFHHARQNNQRLILSYDKLYINVQMHKADTVLEVTGSISSSPRPNTGHTQA